MKCRRCGSDTQEIRIDVGHLITECAACGTFIKSERIHEVKDDDRGSVRLTKFRDYSRN